MNLEKFIRDHLENGKTQLVFDAAVDSTTGKITAIFEDTDKDGQTAHVRIEGNTVTFQSWDLDGEGKPEAPHVSAEKAKAAAAAAATSKKKG